MLEVDDPDWVIIERYVDDDDFEVLIEGTNEGPNPGDDFKDSDPEFYQVVYKTPWRKLINCTKRAPSAEEIRSALNIVSRTPEHLYAEAKMNVLQGLFLRLANLSKQKGFCIVCGRTGVGSSPAHDSTCSLYKALVIIQKPRTS